MKVMRLRLDALLDDIGSNRSILSKESGVSYQVLDRYYKNTITRYDRDVLLRICTALHCGIEELIEIKDIE